jgi:hypothetical protein
MLDAIGWFIVSVLGDLICWVLLLPVAFILCTPFILARAILYSATGKVLFRDALAYGYSTVWEVWKIGSCFWVRRPASKSGGFGRRKTSFRAQ